LIQIVPELPPAVGGVGDYALLLADELGRLGLETTFVVPEPQHQMQLEHPRDLPEVSAVLPRPDALAQRLQVLRPDVVLLHYSGYGFAKRGAPLWLARGLRRWKRRAPAARLVVMFHELWASGPPWTSSFWTSPLQRALAAGVLRLADTYLTNTDLCARHLQRLAPHRSPPAVLPVLSNVGEPDDPRPLEAREPLAVVFGLPGMRVRVYRNFEAFLPTLRTAGIEAILDIGPPLDRRATDGLALPVTRWGYLEPSAASELILSARFGLLDYPLQLAAKSGIFAAYAAHGLVPLLRSAAGGRADGLQHGVNLVRAGEPLPGLPDAAEGLSAMARLWYLDHALERTGRRFLRALGTLEAQPDTHLHSRLSPPVAL
jgi:Glycosyltransferase Family 4